MVCQYLGVEGDDAVAEVVDVSVEDAGRPDPVPLLSVPHQKCVRAEGRQMYFEIGRGCLVNGE